MMQTSTDPRLAKLRQYESILVISGYGVIAFGMWSIVRAAIYYFLNPLVVTDYIKEADLAKIMNLGDEEGLQIITDNLQLIITVGILLLLGFDLLMRLYIGLSARKDGRGFKKSWLYIAVAWFMAISLFNNIATTIDDFFNPIIQAVVENSDTALEVTGKRGDQAASVSIIVDITSLLVLLEVGTCSIMVRRLRKKLGIKPVKKRIKGEKLEISTYLAHELKEELNIPQNQQETKELREELGQQLSDGLRSITG